MTGYFYKIPLDATWIEKRRSKQKKEKEEIEYRKNRAGFDRFHNLINLLASAYQDAKNCGISVGYEIQRDTYMPTIYFRSQDDLNLYLLAGQYSEKNLQLLFDERKWEELSVRNKNESRIR